MKHSERDSFFLLWALVLGIFFLIVAFWIPGLVKSVEVIKTGLGKQKDETTHQWKEQMQQMQQFMNQYIPSKEQTNQETPSRGVQENLLEHNSTSTSYEKE